MSYQNKNIFIIADRGRGDTALRLSFMSYIISKNKNYEPLLLYNYKLKGEIKKIYNKFGIKKIKKVENNFQNFFLIFKTLFQYIVSIFRISFKGFDWFVKSFKINDVQLGDLIWDKYIRNDLSFLKPKLFKIKFLVLLLKSIYNFYILEDIFKKNKIKYSLIASFSYISISSLVLRISQKYNIPTAYISGESFKIFRRNTPKDDPVILEINKIFKKQNFKKLSNKAKIYFKKRISGKLSSKISNPSKVLQHDELNWKNKHRNKNFLLNIKILKKKYKNIILFAPHALSESNHLFGDIIFRDFHQQTTETLGFARNQKKNLWLYKIHPYSEVKYGEFKTSVKIYEKYKQDNIILVPRNVNTSSLFKYVDLVVSSRGTICIEATTFGIKSVITSSIYYDNKKISHRVKNKNEYFKVLKNINLIKKPSKKSILLAKIYLYLRKKLQTENLYNLTEAERMITNKKYYRNIFNKINIIENIDKHFYHKYNEILNKLDTK
jgi:hypothetical protein